MSPWPASLQLPFQEGEVVIVAEAPDNPSVGRDMLERNGSEYYLSNDNDRPSTRLRISFRSGDTTVDSCILIAGDGATGVHAHCAAIRDGTCYVAVGPFVCALVLPALRPLWHVRVDPCTCFGVHHTPHHSCLITHGELQIARLSYSGEIQWVTGGRDIFTGCLSLHENHVEVQDFNGVKYEIEIATGGLIRANDSARA